ncbi:unnamed protein product [Spodoptera littoralis]|uniref:Vitellogenin domain-containing protein n=1 Tax=Spodoptera littoralis TaxID=7109 RepID=A0A9P0I632_SPOLI|nr:unnamed protein product [Spodoptera littoralis]CAH1642126.1 unnamed protein product [Spodoptera littoralis]
MKMNIRIFFVFIVTISTTSSLRSGLQLMFPHEHREYIYILKSNVSTGTWNPRKSATYWQLQGNLHIQVYDNFTKARLFLDELEKLVCCTDHGPMRELETDDDQFLKEPWELEYQDNGYIKSIYVGQEPAWSVNLKRAISINFQVTKDSGTYSVNEPCLDDICAMIYLSRGNLIKKFTSLKVPTARSRNSWASVPWSSVYTGRSVIDSVSSAERTYELDDYKGLSSMELRGSYQYKTHDHILAVNTDLSISYDHDKAAKSVEKLNLIQTTVQYVASDFRDPSNGIRNLSQAYLKNVTYEMLLKIARKGIDADNIVRNASLIHSLDFIDLLNTISRLNYETLISLFNDLVLGTSYELETARNIFLEVLPHARSDASVRFIKYLVLEEKEKVEDAALLSLIRKLPFNVAAPNQALLEELEVLSKLGLDFPPDIRHAGILSFATLLHKTMEISQVKQDYFDNIVVKYFRMYSDCPQYLDRMIWLQGLCNIGYSAESYTRIIHTDSTRDRHERLWAALAGSPKTEDPYTVLETTLPIITNETEHIQLRIIALHSFLSSSNVRETDFMFIHNYIRNCHNNQLKRFWFATMKNLEANKNFSGYRVTSFYVPFVVNQVSNPDPLYWATNNYIISAEEEDSAASLQVFSVGDPEGVLPNFIGARLCTGGRRPFKADIYLVMQGVATSLFKKLNHFNEKNLKVEDLIHVLKKMRVWAVKAPEKVHIDVVIKIQDKAVFATHMNQSRFESGSGEDLAYIEDFLRFGSHINQQIVYYPFQTDVNIPSEMGTPIRLQSTILSFTSIRGNLTAPSTQDKVWKNDLHIRYQGTSVTTLSTDGPLVRSLHSARIQQSLVAHLPMKFNVSFSNIEKNIELTWPNPGAQQGGVAMHSRAQIAVETSSLKSTSTVTAGDSSLSNLDNKSVFFDCERPMTGAEVLDKLFTSKNNHYDFLTSIQPSLIILNSILLFTSPPSGSCGLILPPQHLMKTANDILQLKIQLNEMSVNEDTTKFDLSMMLNYFSQEEPKKVFFEMEALTKIESTGGNANVQLTIHGLQPSTDNITRREWTICLREQDISHGASDQDIAIHPTSYEGHLTITYSGNKTDCFESGPASELTLKYKGIPQNLYGKLERFFEVKIFGSNLSEMGILESDIVTQTALGQLVRSYSKEPLNMTAVIKERNGLASVSVNKGADMQFKSDNFAWLLDSWTDMQIMKTLGLYRECRLQDNLVQLLFGGEELVMTSDSADHVILADCTIKPQFAVIKVKNGVKIYTGGFYVLVTSQDEQKPIVDSSNAGNHFWISHIRDTVKIVSRATDLQVYYNEYDLVVLVPHIYLDSVCGICTNKRIYY